VAGRITEYCAVMVIVERCTYQTSGWCREYVVEDRMAKGDVPQFKCGDLVLMERYHPHVDPEYQYKKRFVLVLSVHYDTNSDKGRYYTVLTQDGSRVKVTLDNYTWAEVTVTNTLQQRVV